MGASWQAPGGLSGFEAVACVQGSELECLRDVVATSSEREACLFPSLGKMHQVSGDESDGYAGVRLVHSTPRR